MAGLFCVGMIAATLAPVAENWREKPNDGFPLSYYPMFSQSRGDSYVVSYIVGVDANGERRKLSHKLAGTGGFNQTRRQLNKFVREKRADELCRNIAAKIATDDRPDYTDVVEARIVTGTYHFADYFAGNTAPAKERIRATAKVKRGEP